MDAQDVVPPANRSASSASSSGILALWVGAELCTAYHGLDKHAKARVRTKVKTLFRDVLHHENPEVSPSGEEEEGAEGSRSQARGLTRAIIDVLRQAKTYISVAEITARVQQVMPNVSAFAVRRVCNRCWQAANPVMLKTSIPNPNPVKQGNRAKVDAFKLTPEVQRKRKSGSVVRDGIVQDTLRERILQVLAASGDPLTAADIKRALKMPGLTMENLYSYISTLKADELIAASSKKQGNARSVNAYTLSRKGMENPACPQP